MTLKLFLTTTLLTTVLILSLGLSETALADLDDVETRRDTYIGDSASLFPSWFNNNLEWYLGGQVDEMTLANAFEWLVNEEIVFLDPDRAKKVRQLEEENQMLKEKIGTDPPPPDPGIILRPVPGALPELPGFPEGCPDVYDPVCGRDGHTYPNECLADNAGAGIAHDGECRDECTSNSACSFGLVCRDGACQAPCDIACFKYDPVCGADGNTYACGEADAQCYGVDVAYDGECTQRPYEECPSGYTWIDCAGICVKHGEDFVCPEDSTWNSAARQCEPDRGDQCEDGHTWIESMGQCIPDDDEIYCPQVYDPVCGVDGKTYGNSCEAGRDGVEVEYEGQCQDQCTSNDNCSFGKVCRDGLCLPPCVVDCIAPDPVCGTDGKTYVCGVPDAQCHGVEVDYEGECEVSGVCPDNYDPVCGVDGLTYGNSCEATNAGVEISHQGGCEIDAVCPENYAPVCGVDGVTYGNSCEANVADVEIAYEGECLSLRAVPVP